MTRRSRSLGLLALALALAAELSGCASTPRPSPRAPARRAPAPAASVPAPATSVPAPAPAPQGFEVAGRAPASNEIVVTGTSDLPEGEASTAGSFRHRADAAAEQLRPALAECLRPLGPPARRHVRAVINARGEFHPRPPQPHPLPPRVASCVEGVLRAGVVDPPPPLDVPFDIYVTVE